MSTPRHSNPSPSVPWVQATWTWSSALLLSALLVSPVGADALFHLLRLHLPVVVQSAEREVPVASTRDQTPRRKDEDEPPAVTIGTPATPDAEPIPTTLDGAATHRLTVQVLPVSVPLARLPFTPWQDVVRSAALPTTTPRAPPV